MLFNDAGKYPQLYRNEMRVDADHLNGMAAGGIYGTRRPEIFASSFRRSRSSDRGRTRT